MFLDEIGNLPIEVQQMLLRALESKMYRPTGGSKDKRADVRIIAATNENLQVAITEKRFRADLYQRLKEYTLHIPPLRECKEDIIPLAEFFLQLANEEFEKQVKGFDAEARKRLLAYTWGGNVRELKRVVHLAVLHTEGDTVTADTLEFDEMPLTSDASLEMDGKETDYPCAGTGERQPQIGCGIARHRTYHAVQQDKIIRHKVQGIDQEHHKVRTGCPTSERQPGGKAFGVTRKVSSNSKHTLLLPLFGSNRKAFG